MNEPITDWIRKNPPTWGHNIIQNMDQDYPEHSEEAPGVRQFIYLIERTHRDIDPDTIIGQWHHYAGQTWLDAIFEPCYKPYKIQSCLNQADSNPSYYFNNLKGIQLTSFDGEKWYSYTSGNHRTIIGKFITAKADAKTGVKHNLQGISTTRYHIDHECFNLYRKLSKIIQGMDIPMSLHAHSESKEGQPNEHEIKIFVNDCRMGNNSARHGWLSAKEFCKFARWVIEHDGKYPMIYLVKDFFGLLPGFEQRRLIYPGMSGQYLYPPTMRL